jgi:quercetin dioxygenase-like cupin family protein
MKKTFFLAILSLIAIFNTAVAQENIFPKGEKAPNVHHTGDVWLTHVSAADETFDYNVAHAAFAPGAKLDWHVHPKGQQLLITEGEGYYQERDQPVQLVKVGDLIKCLPGVEHWHAATPDSDFAYLAITGNEPTKWLEKLTDEAYNSIKIAGSSLEEEIIALSKEKWQWMADKDADKLAELFHDQAKFVHMGGTWGKEREVNIIRSGGIHYKQADIHEVSAEVIDDMVIVWNRITLLAVVGGNEVTNPFMVTEVYKKQDGKWKLANMSFTRLMGPDR